MQRRFFLIQTVSLSLGALMGANRSARADENPLDQRSGTELAQDPSIFLVDIRSPEEWRDTGVIEGARLITFSDTARFLETVQAQMSSGQTLAVICRSGRRSADAVAKIRAVSDMPLIDVAGGMNRILSEGYTPVAPAP